MCGFGHRTIPEMSFTVSMIDVFSIFAFIPYALQEACRDARERNFVLNSPFGCMGGFR
jgi:hypothetical protein